MTSFLIPSALSANDDRARHQLQSAACACGRAACTCVDCGMQCAEAKADQAGCTCSAPCSCAPCCNCA